MDNVSFNAPSHPALNRLRSQINAVAVKHNVPPCALAAVIMRESGGVNEFQQGVPPGPGCGVGVCQITAGVDWTNPQKPTYNGMDLTNTQLNIEVGARYFLAPAIAECLALREQYAERMNDMSPNILFFAFCAYNAGFGAVEKSVRMLRDPDAITTNRYGAGTLAIYQALVTESHNTK